MSDLLDRAWGETAPETIVSGSVSRAFQGLFDSQTSEQLIEANWRERRFEHARNGSTLVRDHRAAYVERWEAAAVANRRRSVLDLLSALAEAHGVAWSDIAGLLGVSVPALRKWRKSSSGTTPDNHLRLARLVAFFDILNEFVATGAQWMSMPLVDGYNICAADLYDDTPQRTAAILDYAAGNAGTAPEGLLDEVVPGWREIWRSEYESFVAEDGVRSLRPRPA
jgi:hypothetical protein